MLDSTLSSHWYKHQGKTILLGINVTGPLTCITQCTGPTVYVPFEGQSNIGEVSCLASVYEKLTRAYSTEIFGYTISSRCRVSHDTRLYPSKVLHISWGTFLYPVIPTYRGPYTSGLKPSIADPLPPSDTWVPMLLWSEILSGVKIDCILPSLR